MTKITKPKIEKLLEEFCPQGVEFLALGEIGKVSMCKRIFKNQTSTIGQIPFYKIGTFGNMPNAFISQEIFDEYRRKFSFPKKGDVLLSASGTIGRRVIYDGKPAYFQDSNIIWIDNDESKVLNRFLFYLYSVVTWQTEGGTIKRLYNDNLKKIKIPIPPLTIQKEIVKILDNFTPLEAELKVELEAELEARKKQYEYYREQLLMVNDKGLMVDGTKVEFWVIGEIVEFVKGASIPRDRTSVDYKVPYLHYGDIYKLYNKEVDVSIEYESIIKVSIDEKVRENQYIHTGDIVYNLTSETKEDLGKAVVIKNDKDCKFIAGTETTVMNIIRKDIINPCFLNYLLMTFSYLNEFRRHTTGTKVFRVHPKAISKISIPIPPLAKQQEIVTILDKFDALVNDILTVLPAEIVARKKQYDYYRNQLLNFKPLDAQDAN